VAEPAINEWTCPTCGRALPIDFALCPHDATPRAEQASRSGDPLIGEVLGRTYRVLRVLGQGGMAKLYEAEHLRIDAHFAIKVIHDDLTGDADLLTRFEREARAAGRIHSEHVVRLVDVLRTADGRPCLVTELLEGEDLQAHLDRVGKLSVADAIPIARQICRAIAAAHAVGVVHRDLKPANVFLCKTAGVPIVKVFDFGVAKLDDDEKLTRTDAVMGTAAYMAPEQARRAADAGPLADVYAIGAVVYHMLAGEPPYGNVPALSRYALVLHEEPTRPRAIDPTIPEGVEAVIQHAMARERTSRIQNAMDLETQLAVFARRPTGFSSSPANRAATQPGAAQPAPDPASRELAPEASAENIALRARITRPVAAFVVGASSLAVGTWLAAFVAAIVGSTSGSERALVALIGLAAVAGMLVLHVRMLRASWSSTPAVSRIVKPFARALLAGTITLGALELLAHGAESVFNAVPLGAGWRLLLAGVAAVLGLGWRRWRLDERLRRRIG
jgi:serine/threonine-protein kinase